MPSPKEIERVGTVGHDRQAADLLGELITAGKVKLRGEPALRRWWADHLWRGSFLTKAAFDYVLRSTDERADFIVGGGSVVAQESE